MVCLSFSNSKEIFVKKYLIAAGVAATFLLPNPAQALPVFARNTGMPCSACHTAYPLLNSYGRWFKENGYRNSPADDPAGPWAMKRIPFAVQAELGLSGKQGEIGETRASVDALQLFMGGPIAPKTSVYIHEHLIMADKPGPLHEAQIRVDRPWDLPLTIRAGKFEPWFAISPGKTELSHFGYNSLNVTVGGNMDTAGSSKFGLGSLWHFNDKLKLALSVFWEENPQGFARLFAKVLNGEIGVFGFAGLQEIAGVVNAKDLTWNDSFYRAGIDFALDPVDWLEISGNVLMDWDANPTGNKQGVKYTSGYLETDLFPIKKLALVARYEQVRYLNLPSLYTPIPTSAAGASLTPSSANPTGDIIPLHGGESPMPTVGPNSSDRYQWVVFSAQYYLRQSVKTIAEYRLDVNNNDMSSLFAGIHFAF